MFSKLIALFALFAVALAAPKANPDYLTYSADYVYPAAAGVPYVSAYSAPYTPYAAVAPVTYSGYPYASYPYANTVFYKK